MQNFGEHGVIMRIKKIDSRIAIAILTGIFLIVAAFGFGYELGADKSPSQLSDNSQSQEAKEASQYGEVKNKEEIPKFLTNDVSFDLMWEVWNIINKKYVEAPVPETRLFYGAMAGSVAALGDPYSIFMEPETSSEFQSELGGKFEGIGAEIAIKKERLTIVAPLPSSPAEKAGLKAGDKVFTIDNFDTTGIGLDEAVNKIRGPKGTKVVLGIMRDEEIKKIEIVREAIKFKSVKWADKGEGIWSITVSHFNDDTSQVFEEAVNSVLAQKPKGIILDLRNNPGGYLDKAIDMASYWIDNDIVVTEKFGKNYNDGIIPLDKKRVYKSTLEAKFKGIKTVVLVNKGSASGSEIVAGALQDYGLATLIGEKTFGKGSVQELEELKNGSSIKITVAKWFTPKDRQIDGEGIAPDMAVELTDEDYNNDKDPQMEKAMEILRAGKP